MNSMDAEKIAKDAIKSNFKWRCSCSQSTNHVDNGNTGQGLRVNDTFQVISSVVCLDCGRIDFFAHGIRTEEA